MAVPINLLTSKHKLDTKSLKAAFDVATMEKRPKVKKLVEQLRDNIRAGIERNRTDYRLYKAMDWAMDTPFYQVSYTQLQGLLSSQPDERKVMDLVNSWGLSHLLPNVIGTDGKPCCAPGSKTPLKALNLPVFFRIFVPICMAYVTMRWAKLFNDRNLVPLFKYDPVQFTKENRFRCEVLTQIVQRMSAQFDYPADTKQTILQTLQYGFCINFPREAWYVEKQLGEDGEEKIIREGLRFNMPHPSRTYYDLYHRLSSLNSNSGCEYAGYWELRRYKEIYDSDLYWNKERITFGDSVGWFQLGNSDFLSQAFPCQMKFPDRAGAGGPTGDLDRESEAARSYGNGDFNSATLVTQHFQRIIPKDHGLGDYEYPVWFRFVCASDIAVIWAEPLAFDVFPTYTYDADFNRSRFRSLTLEIVPFQDHISNLLTQWILSVKENLLNPVFYDKEKVPASYVQTLENLGQKILQGRVFIPFSSVENYRMKVNQAEAFYTPPMSHHPTGELATLISGVLNMLDRIMQLSPQEIGQAAQHEQTAEETRVVAANTGTRVTFTGTGIDAGDYAKKVMIYDATMAYADETVTVGITSALANTKEEFDKLLKSVEFTIDDKSAYDPQKPEVMHTVTGKKTALKVEAFSATRDNTNRINLPGIADAMSKIFLAIAGNPVLIEAIGPPQLVELLNQIIQASGVPQEFRLRGKMVKPAEDPAAAKAQVEAIQKQMQEMAAGMQQLVASKQQETLQLAGQQTTQVVGQAVGEAMQAVQQQAQAAAAKGAQAAAAGLAQAAPAIQQAQQAAQMAGQKIQQHEQEIQNLNVAVAQLTQVVQEAQAALSQAGAPVQPMQS